jgi:hypothetical protein
MAPRAPHAGKVDPWLQRTYFTLQRDQEIAMTAHKERTVWFGMKLTPAQRTRIKRLANAEGSTAKEAILKLVDAALEELEQAPRPGSLLDGIEHLVGSVSGPTDLAANPDHMRGFGQSRPSPKRR